MADIQNLFERNRAWAASVKADDGTFFQRLAQGQRPGYLWIGCSDSRVSATRLTGLRQGDLFVHRNVGNLAPPADANYLAVLQFAVEVLQVEHVIVCGHYGCGGIAAACDHDSHGPMDVWLRHIEDVYAEHVDELEALAPGEQRENLMCELNVHAQVKHVCATSFVQNAWQAGQSLSVHGWIYGLSDGLLQPLVEPIRKA